MNNEQQNNDERFTLVELENGDFVVYNTDEDGARHTEVCIFRRKGHPYVKEAAEAERDRLKAWLREGGNIRPVEYLPKPRRLPTIFGRFSEPPPHTLTVDEKRRFLAEIFRSPDFTASDKFKALQEDNRMLALFGLGNGKEQCHD